MSAGGTNVWELAALGDDASGGAGTNWDLIRLTGGNLALGGSSRLYLKFIGDSTFPDPANPFWQSNRSWTIVQLMGAATNAIHSGFSAVVNGIYNAGVFSTVVDANGSVRLLFVANVPPSITSQPHDQSVRLGSNATFTVLVAGTVPLAYQWYFNSSANPLASATSSSYTRTNVQLSDAGLYWVVITNLAGTVTSSNATLALAPIQPLQFSQILLLSDHAIGLALCGEPGSYLVERSSNLINWLPWTNVLNGGGIVNFVDDGDSNAPTRFYRASAVR